MCLIGISEEQLAKLVEDATRRGYEAARRDMEQSEWLTSRTEICLFLSPEKPISPATFNRNRAKGMYGSAVVGTGMRCKARKNDLLQAIQNYQLSTI